MMFVPHYLVIQNKMYLKVVSIRHENKYKIKHIDYPMLNPDIVDKNVTKEVNYDEKYATHHTDVLSNHLKNYQVAFKLHLLGINKSSLLP